MQHYTLDPPPQMIHLLALCCGDVNEFCIRHRWKKFQQILLRQSEHQRVLKDNVQSKSRKLNTNECANCILGTNDCNTWNIFRISMFEQWINQLPASNMITVDSDAMPV